MKIKFNIKLLSHLQNPSSNKISTSSRSKEEITNNNIQKSEFETYTNTENIFEYNIESIDYLQNLSIASLKYNFAKTKKLNPDSIILYKLNKEKLYEEIPDYISLSNIIKNGIDYIYELYYKIYDKIIKITINFYQMNIEKIFMKLSSICSIQMLKMIINEKLNNSIEVDSQKIFGLYIININTKEKKIMNQSKEINNKTIIKNIINSYFENKNSEYMIFFLLSRNLNNKLQMGLNFKFNYLKNISKIKFNNKAPSYCECSDGINLFAYCRKENCILNNNLFIKVLGYGIFNIMKEIEKVNCPFCNNKSEVKNIGLINSKWFYKGKLNCPKQNCFEGDGITIDDQLYILKESKISSLLLKLIIEVKPHIMKKDNNDINFINDLEDISLCENNKQKIQIEDFNVLNQIKNNVKYYETESEIKSMNVEIDKGEKIFCQSCKISDDNTCYIF